MGVKLRSLALVAVAAALAVGCGEDDGPSAEERQINTARDSGVQREVELRLVRDTERRIKNQSGAYVDPDLGAKTTAECLPASRIELSCTVQGRTQPGFGDYADPTAAGRFSWEWEVLVDPATGRFKAEPTEMRGGV